MTEQEYKQKLKEIESRHNKDKFLLAKKYALSQARYNIGDIIQESVDIIKIDKIRFAYGFGIPYPFYEGVRLKKNLTPYKAGARCTIYDGDNNPATLLKESE